MKFKDYDVMRTVLLGNAMGAGGVVSAEGSVGASSALGAIGTDDVDGAHLAGCQVLQLQSISATSC